jgi:hypothetical protein
MGFQFHSVASLSPFLVDELGLTHAQVGWLTGLYRLPGGALYTAYYVGVALAQPAAGLVRDLTASPAAPLVFAAAVMAATVVGLAVFRRLAPPRALRPEA